MITVLSKDNTILCSKENHIKSCKIEHIKKHAKIPWKLKVFVIYREILYDFTDALDCTLSAIRMPLHKKVSLVAE